MTEQTEQARRHYGDYLRTRRIFAQCSIEEAAQTSNVSIEHMRAFEAGDAIPPYDVLKMLSQLYDVHVKLLSPDHSDRLLARALSHEGAVAE